MNKTHFKKSSNNKSRNFYIALGVCLIAVGAAAWTTYDGVMKFVAPSDNDTVIEQHIENMPEEPNKTTANTISGVVEEKQKPIASDAKKEEKVEKTNADVIKSDTLVIYPVGKNIIKDYSDSNPVYSKTLQDWRVHNGIDFAAEKGSKVKSISGGVVRDVYEDPALGRTMVREHDGGFFAYYSGLGDTTLVKKGDKVVSGQDIGSINDIPSEVADEAHLHLAIKQGEKWVNPKTILDKAK